MSLFDYVFKSDAISRQLETAMHGLSQDKVDRLSSEIYTYIQMNWQAMVNLHSCCNRIFEHPHEYDNYDTLTAACDRVLWLQANRPCLALAQAHAGPSQVDCSPGAPYLFDSIKGFDAEVQRQDIMGFSMYGLKSTLTVCHGAGSWNVLMLARVFKDAAESLQSVYTTGEGEQPDWCSQNYSFNTLVRLLNRIGFVAQTVPPEWLETGLPLHVSVELPGRQVSTGLVLLWAVRYSLTCSVLQEYHQYVTKAPDLRHCSNVSDWFDDDMWFTQHGKVCLHAITSKAVPAVTNLPASSTFNIRSGASFSSVSAFWPSAGLWSVLPQHTSSEKGIADGALEERSAAQLSNSPLDKVDGTTTAADSVLDELHATTKLSLVDDVLRRCIPWVVVIVLACCLLWQLISWGQLRFARTLHSYAHSGHYSNEQKRQQAAKSARRAATDGLRSSSNSKGVDAGSSSSARQSPAGSGSTAGSPSRSQQAYARVSTMAANLTAMLDDRRKHGSSPRHRAGRRLIFNKQVVAPAAQQVPPTSSWAAVLQLQWCSFLHHLRLAGAAFTQLLLFVLSLLASLFVAAWHKVASGLHSVAQSFIGLLGLLFRPVVAVWRFVKEVAAAAAHAARAMVV